MISKWPYAASVQMFILSSEPACGSTTPGCYKCFWIICKVQYRRRRSRALWYCEHFTVETQSLNHYSAHTCHCIIDSHWFMQLICPVSFFNLFPLNGFLCQQTMSVSDCSLSFGVIFPMEMSKLMGMDLTTSSKRWMLRTYFKYKLPGLSHYAHWVTQIS